MNLLELAGLMDGVENDPAALRELAAHWDLAGHWNDSAVWTADMLMQHARDVADSNGKTDLSIPLSWE